MPARLTPGWWRAQRDRIEWLERRRAFLLRPEGEQDAGIDTAVAPPPAPISGGKSPSEAFRGFIGQPRAVRSLSLALEAARLRGETPPPALLSGPAGLGKTTLARLTAQSLGSRLQITVGSALADAGALVGILASLDSGDVFFIDEIHGLPAAIAEQLYRAIDERMLSITLLQGSEARAVELEVHPFFLIGATTEEELIPRPFRSRFALKERLEPYSREDLEEIARSRGLSLGAEVTAEAARALALASRGAPRDLLLHLGRCRDQAQVEAGRAAGVAIDGEAAWRALALQGIDNQGLSETDRRILRVLAGRRRPLGLRSLADLLGENPRALQEIHEPHLLREGFLARTWRGRAITGRGRRAIQLPPSRVVGAASPESLRDRPATPPRRRRLRTGPLRAGGGAAR